MKAAVNPIMAATVRRYGLGSLLVAPLGASSVYQALGLLRTVQKPDAKVRHE